MRPKVLHFPTGHQYIKGSLPGGSRFKVTFLAIFATSGALFGGVGGSGTPKMVDFGPILAPRTPRTPPDPPDPPGTPFWGGPDPLFGPFLVDFWSILASGAHPHHATQYCFLRIESAYQLEVP